MPELPGMAYSGFFCAIMHNHLTLSQKRHNHSVIIHKAINPPFPRINNILAYKNTGGGKMKHIALIPAYCPGTPLVKLTEELTESGISCLVVDDGSSDQSIFQTLNKDIVVLHHETNKGKGAAMKTGMRYIQENEGECIVVTADADGQHLATDILHCGKKAEEQPDSLILGARQFNKEYVPMKSYYGNKITESIFSIFTGTHISDTQTGLRAFHSSLIPRMLAAEGERYEYETNQLLYCVRNQIPMLEVPITTVYEDNNKGSHFHPLRDSALIYSQILRYSVANIIRF